MWVANPATDDVDREPFPSVDFFEQNGLELMPSVDELWGAVY
jgi:hypothetical protein